MPAGDRHRLVQQFIKFIKAPAITLPIAFQALMPWFAYYNQRNQSGIIRQ